MIQVSQGVREHKHKDTHTHTYTHRHTITQTLFPPGKPGAAAAPCLPQGLKEEGTDSSEGLLCNEMME